MTQTAHMSQLGGQLAQQCRVVMEDIEEEEVVAAAALDAQSEGGAEQVASVLRGMLCDQPAQPCAPKVVKKKKAKPKAKAKKGAGDKPAGLKGEL